MSVVASVIIPTHGRPEKLQRCLAALSCQRLAAGDSLEIVVAEDGATTRSEQVGADGAAVDRLPLPDGRSDEERGGAEAHGPAVSWLKLPRVGIAGARNAALRAAAGDLLLFINDDCYPDPDWARHHIAAHAAGGDTGMVVGRTDWMDWPSPTVFDALLRETSMIFFYDRMQDGACYGFRHFWTCNASVPARVAKAVGGFDERLRPYGFEDIEFAFRIERAGHGGVRYVESARNVHDHRVGWRDYLNRESCLGRMAACLSEVNPDCFGALYGDEGPDAMRAEFEAWLAMDAVDHDRVAAAIASAVAAPLRNDASWPALRDALEAAHRPIKRRHFRQGFVGGFDIRHDGAWRARLALGHSFP